MEERIFDPGRVIARALPGRRVKRWEAVSGGVTNTVCRILLEDTADQFALKIYTRDPTACRKEIDIYHLVSGRIPVPELVYADIYGEAGSEPCTLTRWTDGPTFREIKSRRDPGEIAQCGRAMGEVLASIGAFRFASSGIIGPGLAIGPGPVEGPDPVPRMIEKFLAMPCAIRRIKPESISRAVEFAWSLAPQLATLDHECRLVHSDFGSPNLIMQRRQREWQVAAVLDWEFAFSGSPLYDVGHILRYERLQRPSLEPHFSESFRESGGRLPENWRQLARALDLTALSEMLAPPALPDSVVTELVTLLERSIQ